MNTPKNYYRRKKKNKFLLRYQPDYMESDIKLAKKILKIAFKILRLK